MKVLFAVSNEEISGAIVKRYQKDYKEIISYKNVYYFNAIIKELQKDKTFDRIVISEELEAFSNTQYAQIDKFIFDKLDNISDEATNARGDNIPIIVIASDRRQKAEEMLTKMFGIGIYDVLLGNDRSVGNVCQLLNKPRTKKEAKIYYKIESDDVSYQSEDENDVSEVEIQNILAHYRRLGKDEQKYVESFDNIASQYNDVQLKIICKFLPLNVKAVLEERSAKYQELNSNGNNTNPFKGKSKPAKEQVNDNKETSEKFLKIDKHENMKPKHVVIPSAVDMSGVKKLSKMRSSVKSVESIPYNDDIKYGTIPNNNQQAQQPLQGSYTSQTMDYQRPPVTPKSMNQVQPQPIQKKVMTRQEEPEEIPEAAPEPKVEPEHPVEEVKRKRGRPRKNPLPEATQEAPVEPVKKKRGRPRKYFPQEETVKKVKIREQEEAEENELVLPGFDNNSDSEANEVVLPGFDSNDEQDETNEVILPGFGSNDDSSSNNNDDDDTSSYIEEDDGDTSSYIEQEDNDNTSSYFNNDDEEDSYLPGINETRQTSANSRMVEDQPIGNIGGYGDSRSSTQYGSIQNSSYEYEDVDISNLLTADKRIACFVGTTKNGTSFVVNNLGQVTSEMGINTAILDTTKNRNSYYIYNQNDENLRKVAMSSISSLLNGNATGIQVNKNLTIYTSLPEETEGIENAGQILKSLLKKHSLILIDCDFATPQDYFKKTQEIYLVQTLDILTIQPLTSFLRNLKSKNILYQDTLRIVLNKTVNLKGIDEKLIIRGMASYKDPSMSFMTDLFDKDTIKHISIPFSVETYAKYLENIVNCEVSVRGYPKNIIQVFNDLAKMVYPLNVNRTSTTNYIPPSIERNNAFSAQMNSTLNQMKKNY